MIPDSVLFPEIKLEILRYHRFQHFSPSNNQECKALPPREKASPGWFLWECVFMTFKSGRRSSDRECLCLVARPPPPCEPVPLSIPVEITLRHRVGCQPEGPGNHPSELLPTQSPSFPFNLFV